jgi:serine phosphatase RsbU (regulator of sigma subunit)
MTMTTSRRRRTSATIASAPVVRKTAADARVATYVSPAGGVPVGGDWCEVLPLSDRVLALTIGDVAGHGEASSPLMTVVRAAVLAAIRNGHVPSDALAIANTVVCEQGGGVMVTGVVALFDRLLQTLTFANAGHPPPLLVARAGHAFIGHPEADLPLGVFGTFRAFDHQYTLAPDSLAVLYTDGITEHDRDPIAGESELIEAARFAHARPKLNAAYAIARHVLATKRGDDDAATLALRTMPARLTLEYGYRSPRREES